jgi:hypothetical protein
MVQSDANTLDAVSPDRYKLAPLAGRDVGEIRDEAVWMLREGERRNNGIGKIDLDGYSAGVGDDANVVDDRLRS